MSARHELLLATRPFASDRTGESWWYVLSTLLFFATAVAGTFLREVPLVSVVASVLSGLLLLRLFVIYHDQQHHAILARSWVAEGLMRAVGILALSASSVWRTSHNHHHNHNSKLRGSQIGSFPVMTRTHFAQASRRDRFRYLAMRHPLTILCGYLTTFLIGMCLNPFLNNSKRHADCLVALLVHLGIGIGLYWWGGWTQVILTQTAPHFIACAIGSYLFYAQHNFPAVSLNEKDGWTYEKAALESSSFLETGAIMSWFTANIGYHHIHHLNAKIPFYRLPEIMRAMPELQHPRTTSLRPSEIMRCLGLKVWDVDRGRMIGFREMANPVEATRPAPALLS